MPAELGLDRSFGERAFFQLEGRGLERRHHLATAEKAEVAAVGGRRPGRAFPGQGGEIAAFLQVGDDRLGLVFRLDKDMTRLDLPAGGPFLGRFFVAGPDVGVADNFLDGLGKHHPLQDLVLDAGHLVLEFLLLVQVPAPGVGGRQPGVDEAVHQAREDGLERHLLVLLRQAPVRGPDIGQEDVMAVDGGDHGVFGGKTGMAAGGRDDKGQQDGGREARKHDRSSFQTPASGVSFRGASGPAVYASRG